MFRTSKEKYKQRQKESRVLDTGVTRPIIQE